MNNLRKYIAIGTFALATLGIGYHLGKARGIEQGRQEQLNRIDNLIQAYSDKTRYWNLNHVEHGTLVDFTDALIDTKSLLYNPNEIIEMQFVRAEEKKEIGRRVFFRNRKFSRISKSTT